MLRSILIYLSQANWARNLVLRFPLSRRVALRFVAGETLKEALPVVKELNDAGRLVTVDLLGEHSATPDEAVNATDKIIRTINAISEGKLRAGISLKLTQIGLKLDQKICEENLLVIVEHASDQGIFVRVDMEEAACLVATLELVNKIRSRGFQNIGTVVQSYMFRSPSDIQNLMRNDVRVRLVKGAYIESPEIAFPKKI